VAGLEQPGDKDGEPALERGSGVVRNPAGLRLASDGNDVVAGKRNNTDATAGSSSTRVLVQEIARHVTTSVFQALFEGQDVRGASVVVFQLASEFAVGDVATAIDSIACARTNRGGIAHVTGIRGAGGYASGSNDARAGSILSALVIRIASGTSRAREILHTTAIEASVDVSTSIIRSASSGSRGGGASTGDKTRAEETGVAIKGGGTGFARIGTIAFSIGTDSAAVTVRVGRAEIARKTVNVVNDAGAARASGINVVIHKTVVINAANGTNGGGFASGYGFAGGTGATVRENTDIGAKGSVLLAILSESVEVGVASNVQTHTTEFVAVGDRDSSFFLSESEDGSEGA